MTGEHLKAGKHASGITLQPAGNLRPLVLHISEVIQQLHLMLLSGVESTQHTKIARSGGSKGDSLRGLPYAVVASEACNSRAGSDPLRTTNATTILYGKLSL